MVKDLLKRLGNIPKVFKYFLDFNSTLKYQDWSKQVLLLMVLIKL